MKKLIDFETLAYYLEESSTCFHCEHGGTPHDLCIDLCSAWQSLEVPSLDNMVEIINYNKLPQICKICDKRFLWKESKDVCQDCKEDNNGS